MNNIPKPTERSNRTTTDSAAALAAFEARIRTNLDEALQFCEALARIKRDRLYRAMHGSFEAYIAERWNLPMQFVRRCVKLAESQKVVGGCG